MWCFRACCFALGFDFALGLILDKISGFGFVVHNVFVAPRCFFNSGSEYDLAEVYGRSVHSACSYFLVC